MLNNNLLYSCLAFSWVAAILGILTGFGMLLKPGQLLRLNHFFSRGMSTDKFGEQIDRPRWTERFFYRHHKLVGVGLFIGAIVVLDTFLFSYNVRKISSFVARDYWWLLDAMVGLILVGNVLSAIVGLTMLTKPSLLRDFENSANRWISTDRLLEWFNRTNNSVEQSIFQHRKLSGACLIFGSFYILVALIHFSFRGAGKF